MKYLGVEPSRPRVAVFDFTSCEGCELQLVNKEETLVDFLKAIEIVNFREVTTSASDEYDLALIEGAITRADEIERLEAIRGRASILVAMGSCACFGGVTKLKNAYDLDEANREVYGDSAKETLPTRAIKDVVKVDLEIPGCPVNKAEVERIVQRLIWGVAYEPPAYPVCMECKQRYTVCVHHQGQMCLGPITRAGCDAPCPASGQGCLGCRGPAEAPNYDKFLSIVKSMGFNNEEINEKLSFFGGFEVSA